MRQANVRRFNTQDTPDEAISALQTGREREIAYIGDIIEQNTSLKKGAVQHVLVKAPRGFGKSYLTRLIEIDCRQLSQVKLVMLPEELRNVKAPADLLKEIERLTKGEDWQQVVSMWDEDDESWDEAVASLDETINEVMAEQLCHSKQPQGLLVVVLENLDILIKQVFSSDLAQQTLRKWLTRDNSRVMLLATSTGSVDSQYDLPIFHLFDEMPLSPWDENQCVDYFNALRRFSQQAALSPEQLAKAKAISQFIGGNPRLARLLGGVLNSNDALSVANTLDELVDELADYYRRLVDDLTSKANLLLDALIRQGEPCSQSELAARVGTKQSRIARAFAELHRNQIVTGKRVTGGRETLYQVTDRVFVHFYRTRYGGIKNGQSPLVAIAELLKSFFTEPEKVEKTVDFLERGMFSEGRLMTGLMEPNADGEIVIPDYVFHEFQWRLALYIEAVRGIDGKQISNDIGANEAVLMDAANNLITDPESSLSQCKNALKKNESGPYAVLWLLIKNMTLIKLMKHKAPLGCLNEALELARTEPELLFICFYEIGAFYWEVKTDVKTSYEYTVKAAQLTDQITHPIFNIFAIATKAHSLIDRDNEQSLQILKSALSLIEKATNTAIDDTEKLRQSKFISKLQVRIMNRISFAYLCLNSFDKALSYAKKVLEMQPASSQSLSTKSIDELVASNYCANALSNLKRYEEAIEQYQQTVVMANRMEEIGTVVDSYWFIARGYIALHQYEQALEYVNQGIDYANNYAFVYKTFHLVWLTRFLFDIAQHIPVKSFVGYFERLLPFYEGGDHNLPNIGWLWYSLSLAVFSNGQWRELLTSYAENETKLAKLLKGDYWGSRDYIARKLAEFTHKLVENKNIATAYACMVNFIDAIADAKQTNTYDDFFPPLVRKTLQDILRQCQNASFLNDVGQLLANHDSDDFIRESQLFDAASKYYEAGKDKAVLERVDPDISAAILRMLG